MDSKVYLSNTFYKDNEIQKCYIYKIETEPYIDTKNIYPTNTNLMNVSVTQIFPNKNKVKFLLWNGVNEFAHSFLYYSRKDGLLLDGFGIGINVLNLDEETYKKIHKKASQILYDMLMTDGYDEISQIIADKRMKYENGGLSIKGNASIHHAKIRSLSGPDIYLMLTGGAFSNLLEVLGIANTKLKNPVTCDIMASLSEDTTLNVSNADGSVNFKYHDTAFNETVRNVNGTMEIFI